MLDRLRRQRGWRDTAPGAHLKHITDRLYPCRAWLYALPAPTNRSPGPDSMTFDVLTFDQFSDKIGQAFVIEEDGLPPVELTLTEARPLPNYANAARSPFSLLFTTRGDFILPQRMYGLRHTSLGLQSIFLVPIAKDRNTATYEAVFN